MSYVIFLLAGVINRGRQFSHELCEKSTARQCSWQSQKRVEPKRTPPQSRRGAKKEYKEERRAGMLTRFPRLILSVFSVFLLRGFAGDLFIP